VHRYDCIEVLNSYSHRLQSPLVILPFPSTCLQGCCPFPSVHPKYSPRMAQKGDMDSPGESICARRTHCPAQVVRIIWPRGTAAPRSTMTCGGLLRQMEVWWRCVACCCLSLLPGLSTTAYLSTGSAVVVHLALAHARARLLPRLAPNARTRRRAPRAPACTRLCHVPLSAGCAGAPSYACVPT